MWDAKDQIGGRRDRTSVKSIEGGVASEKSVEVIILVIRKGEKLIRLVPELFCETMVNIEVEAL